MKVGRPIAAMVVVTLLVWPLAGVPSAAQTTSALRVQSAGEPRRVHGSDGREHIEYDLVMTNSFPGDITVASLEVGGSGTRLLSLSGARLRSVTLRLATFSPAGLSVAPGSTVVILVDVSLPRLARRSVPGLLANRIRYAIPGRPPLRPVIGSTTIDMPALQVDQRAPAGRDRLTVAWFRLDKRQRVLR